MSQHLADLFARWERERPDRNALRFGSQSWTWADWGYRIRRNAGAQLSLGLRPGDRVAFLDKNHPASLETSYGCALAGTVQALLNFRLAAEEYVYLLNDCRARLLFVGTEFVDTIESVWDRLEFLEHVVVVGGSAGDGGYEAFLASAPPVQAPVSIDPDDLLLQLYTSGTTGLPKGAMLTHRGVQAHSAAGVAAFGLDANSVSQVAMPLYHVGGTNWGLIGQSVGGSVVLDREVVPSVLLDELSAGITHTFLVPAVLGVLVEMPEVGQCNFEALRVVAYGASPISPTLLERCLKVFDADFLGLYGMTETSGILTALAPAAHRDQDNPHRLRSVGLPMPGVELRVVDPESEADVAADQVGEVWARTAQLMRGYHNKPVATAEAFRPGGWFRTGDAARRDADGFLYVTDRLKDMIISGGENVYPVEVERVLSEHPSVAAVAVVGMPDHRWGEVPVAFVVPAPGESVNESELIEYTRQRLAKYKCPASVRPLDELPRNPTGKVLKTELRRLL